MSYRKIDKGDTISEYTLVEKLGQGGFGEVWKAQHNQIPGKFVAIKIPTLSENMECLKKEALFQHELDHPNIVKTIGLNTKSDPPYFIMEYVDGKSLRQLMREDGILPPPYAIDIAVQACGALAFAHSKGIVHKDIKPENILVEKRRVDVSKRGKAILHLVKITDLGLGKVPDRSPGDIQLSENAHTTGVRMLSGTLFYMAPEQMVPDRAVDPRADLYALGVVLYEMLTGELPLGMDLPSEINPVVTPELDAICKRALSIDRDARYATAGEMAADLQKAKEKFLLRLVAAGAPAAEIAPDGTLRPHLPPAAPRRRWRGAMEWVLLGVVGLLLAASAVTFVRLKKKADVPTATARIHPRPAVLPGPLIVSSKPPGAEVRLDGRRLGTSPVELKDVSFERHVLKLSRDFHADREFVLEPRTHKGRAYFCAVDATTGKEFALRARSGGGYSLEGIEQERLKGTVWIDTTNEKEASVIIDGLLYGLTPFNQVLEAGMHHILITKEGYRDFSFFEKVEAGPAVEKRIALVPLDKTDYAGPVRIQVTSSPSEATLFINGEEKGRTPCELDLPVGDYELRLVKEYYEPRTAAIRVNSPSSYEYPLTKVRSRVAFDSEPQGAAVYLDNAKIGVTPVTLENVPGGSHRATFGVEGYYDQSIPFKVLNFDPVGPVKATLLKIPPGRIAIDGEMKGAEVFLDGKSAGRLPVASRAIESGKHRVRILGTERIVWIEPELEKKIHLLPRDVEMVYVPEGEFGYGAVNPKPGEIAARTERTGAFYIDRFEVTNEQYALFYACISETGNHSLCPPGEGKRDHKPALWGDEKYKDFNLPSKPVVGVGWYDAVAYAAWAGKRLPTEREWEKAARGNKRWTYPWGNEWNDKGCNWGDEGLVDGFENTAPVGAFPEGVSPLGCYDMVGNAKEWCADDYHPKDHAKKVIRGGDFLMKEWNTTTSREYENPLFNSRTLGFRCVVDQKK